MLDENGGMVMPVSPMGNGSSLGNGFGGDGGWWILLLFILLVGGNGWGNNGFGGGSNGNLYPWMNQSEQVNNGFRDQMINGNITSIRDGIAGLSTQLCDGFGNVQMALANGFAGVEQGANARQMANMQSMFNLQSQFSDCCCENRLANCQTQNIIQNEGNATRFSDANNTRDIINNQNTGIQRILDQLCADKIDAKNERIADLERQLTMANLAASQTAQTSRILADNAAQTVALEQYLNPVPVPAYVVQNPNCCANPCGYNCGCSA